MQISRTEGTDTHSNAKHFIHERRAIGDEISNKGWSAGDGRKRRYDGACGGNHNCLVAWRMERVVAREMWALPLRP